MSNENLTLLTDFYELTMMQGYFKNQTNPTVVFDMFYRVNPNNGGYAICCGLEPVSYTHLVDICSDTSAAANIISAFETR